MKMRVLWMFAQNLHNNRHELLTVAWFFPGLISCGWCIS
jgi:hypothetical protein